MTKDEIYIWILDKMKSCYPTKSTDNDHIFWFYDEQYIRKQKLCEINNQEINLPNKPKGICMFYQNTDSKYLVLSYEHVWKFIEDNYIDDYLEIQNLITEIVNDINIQNLKEYIYPDRLHYFRFPELILNMDELIIYDEYCDIYNNLII